jgi:hypothetical protein
MSFQASCPACAAPITFEVTGSVVTVCKSCHTVAGRGDGGLEDFGKVADLVQTDSPLKLGLRGKFKGVPFEITGRAQLKHSGGGIWDEWYVAFRGGKRWGWLAEAQGRLYLTFRQKLPEKHAIPPFENLDVGEEVMIPKLGGMTVVEIGEATAVSAEGEIPYVLKPGESSFFADLSGPGRKFATLDESESPPLLFAGREVTFKQLGIADAIANREKEERRVAAVQVNCPTCGGSLELRAPDETQRVACPYCGALHEADRGNLRFLETLGEHQVEPLIPLGTVGTFNGELLGESPGLSLDFTIIGFLQRKVKAEGVTYYWQEYLLYRPRMPACWLIHSNGHWSLGHPIPAGEVYAGPRTATYAGQAFKIYERSDPVVTYVLGEFSWKVSVGERSRAADYICPPLLLSRESTPKDEQEPTEEPEKKMERELNYTLSRYLSVEQVEQAFGVKELRHPQSVAPSQPYPHKGVYKLAGALFLAAILIALVVFASGSQKQIFSQQYQLKPNQAKELFSKTLKVEGGKNLMVRCVAASWVYVSGEFYDEKSGRVRASFGIPRGEAVFLSALPAGDYTLRMTVQADRKPATARAKRKPRRAVPNRRPVGALRNRGPVPALVKERLGGLLTKRTQPTQFSISVQQGVPHWSHLVFLIVGLSIIPIGTAIHHMSFEARRWQDSDYSPFHSGEGE